MAVLFYLEAKQIISDQRSKKSRNFQNSDMVVSFCNRNCIIYVYILKKFRLLQDYFKRDVYSFVDRHNKIKKNRSRAQQPPLSVIL